MENGNVVVVVNCNGFNGETGTVKQVSHGWVIVEFSPEQTKAMGLACSESPFKPTELRVVSQA